MKKVAMVSLLSLFYFENKVGASARISGFVRVFKQSAAASTAHPGSGASFSLTVAAAMVDEHAAPQR
jgi:hypothetical protein